MQRTMANHITPNLDRADALRPIFAEVARQERSDAWLARKIGLSKQYVCDIKHGRYPMPPGFVRACALVLNLNIADLRKAQAFERPIVKPKRGEVTA